MKSFSLFSRLRAAWISKASTKLERLIEILVDPRAMIHNIGAFKIYGKKIAPVLKANAYGHGLTQVASVIEKAHPSEKLVPFLCVDSYFEALRLRRSGLRKKILVMGYTPLETIQNSRLKNIAYSLLSLDELKRLCESKTRTTIHLFLDTGMHRYGILPEQVDNALKLLQKNPQIHVDGVCSHLADAEAEASNHLKNQIATWNELVEKIRSALPNLRHFHCAQTAGSAYSEQLNHCNVIRLGLGLYGINNSVAQLSLKPALELHSRVSSLRQLEPGESIGYGASYTTTKKTLVATVPIGYSEGVNRQLSSKGFFEWTAPNGRIIPCPIVGRVSMNITSIDVSECEGIQLDDPIRIISKNPASPCSVQKIAEDAGLIPYEVLVGLSEGLQRSLTEKH